MFLLNLIIIQTRNLSILSMFLLQSAMLGTIKGGGGCLFLHMSNIVKCFKKKIIFFSRELFEAEQDDLGEYEFFDFFKITI